MNPYNVLLRPIISEKSNGHREKSGQYSFRVNPAANKKDVADAVAKLYEVNVKQVRTSITRGKIKRRGMILSKPRKYKKAIVTLAGDQKIPIFDEN